ncbi:MAG: ABC transporter permease [Desulfobacterales bacterium]
MRNLFHYHRIIPWIIPVIFLAAWFLATKFGWVPGYLLPDPFRIIQSGYVYLFADIGSGPYAGRFLDDTLVSVMRVGSGFSVAVLLGIPLGVVSGRMSICRRLMSTTINGLRAVPGICWLPLALVWFGIGMQTTVFLVALAAFFPIYINTAAGTRQVSPLLYQAGAMLGVGRFRGIFAILLPAAMPQIISGLRLGLGLAWAYLVLGELTGVPNGLGAVIMDARMLGRIDIIIVGIIIIAVMGRISDLLLNTVLRLFFKSARRMA